MKTVILSAGHSLSDPGAVYDPGTKEAFLTMELTKLASDYLRKHGIGVLTVPDDLNLVSTIKWVNNRSTETHIELAVEIHTNSSTDRKPRGVEAWYYHDFNTGKGSEDSKRLAQAMVDAIQVEANMPSRGVFDESTNRWGRLGFVHDTYPLAALLEAGFISNEEDRRILMDTKGRENIAKGICRGILTAMGETWRPELLHPETKPEIEDAKDKQIEDLKKAVASAESYGERKLAEFKAKCQTRSDEIKLKLNEAITLTEKDV